MAKVFSFCIYRTVYLTTRKNGVILIIYRKNNTSFIWGNLKSLQWRNTPVREYFYHKQTKNSRTCITPYFCPILTRMCLSTEQILFDSHAMTSWYEGGGVQGLLWSSQFQEFSILVFEFLCELFGRSAVDTNRPSSQEEQTEGRMAS